MSFSMLLASIMSIVELTEMTRYVIINHENIEEGAEGQFQKLDLNEISHLGAEYDLCSLMHYGEKAFSKVYLFNCNVF